MELQSKSKTFNAAVFIHSSFIPLISEASLHVSYGTLLRLENNVNVVAKTVIRKVKTQIKIFF